MRALLLLVLTAILSGCTPGGRDVPGAGQIAIVWRGSAAGTFRAAASATLCAETGQVELIAVQGDSGVAFVFFPTDSAALPAVEYPILVSDTIEADRPSAMAALKWFDGTDLPSFEGLRGTVRITSSGEEASGSVEATFRLHQGEDTLRVTGRFLAVPVERAPTGCGAVHRRNLG